MTLTVAPREPRTRPSPGKGKPMPPLAIIQQNEATNALRASVISSQAGRGNGLGPYHRVRRGNSADRGNAGMPPTWDADDWWVEEQKGPSGAAWIFRKLVALDAEDTDSGEIETWVYQHATPGAVTDGEDGWTMILQGQETP